MAQKKAGRSKTAGNLSATYPSWAIVVADLSWSFVVADERVAQPHSTRVVNVVELELIQSHMAKKPVLRGEVGCACVAREVSVERRGMGERGCARRLGGVWV